MDTEEVASIIVDSTIKIHQLCGPGLLETAYQKCLAHELVRRGLSVECEIALPIVYEGEIIDQGYRINMLVNGCIIIENKTVDHILPINEAQRLPYMRLSQFRLGFILYLEGNLNETWCQTNDHLKQ
jgi:GxxExxY protein